MPFRNGKFDRFRAIFNTQKLLSTAICRQNWISPRKPINSSLNEIFSKFFPCQWEYLHIFMGFLKSTKEKYIPFCYKGSFICKLINIFLRFCSKELFSERSRTKCNKTGSLCCYTKTVKQHKNVELHKLEFLL